LRSPSPLSFLAADGSPRGIREGGTFKVGVTASFIRTIDPALVGLPLEYRVLWPACEILVAYPAKPPPAGLQLPAAWCSPPSSISRRSA
jgi:hypothetical protein